MSSLSTYMLNPDRILLPALVANSQPVYLMDARRQWLKVNCVERIEIWPLLNYTAISIVYRKPEIGNVSKPYSSILEVYLHLNQGEWVSPLVNSQCKLNTVMGGGAQDQQKINITNCFFKEKMKNLSESDLVNEVA